LTVSPLWKTEYLDGCNTTIRIYCEKGGYCGRQAYIIEVEKVVLSQRCIFWIGRLGI